jgi:transposase-like protein
MAQYHITVDSEVLHHLFLKDAKDSGMSKLLESVLNQVLEAQVTEHVGAERDERNEDRQSVHNGSRSRALSTRVGTITIRVPQLRDGSFSTALFGTSQRSEQAFVLALMEMVVVGFRQGRCP